MTDTLKIVPTTDYVTTGVRNAAVVAQGLAERMRALVQIALLRLDELTSRSRVKNLDEIPFAGGMMDNLASDHELLAHRLHALVKLSDDHKDPVTEDLATKRSAFHEHAAWMLRHRRQLITWHTPICSVVAKNITWLTAARA